MYSKKTRCVSKKGSAELQLLKTLENHVKPNYEPYKCKERKKNLENICYLFSHKGTCLKADNFFVLVRNFLGGIRLSAIVISLPKSDVSVWFIKLCSNQCILADNPVIDGAVSCQK